MFNIIAPYITDARVLDLFAGTGSLGIEALSRGASFGVFVDKSLECHGIIKENLIHTRLFEKAQLCHGDSIQMLDRLGGQAFDIIFLDPPYSKGLVHESLKGIIKNGIINEHTIVVAETDAKDAVLDQAYPLKMVNTRRYGDTLLLFYKYNL